MTFSIRAPRVQQQRTQRRHRFAMPACAALATLACIFATPSLHAADIERTPLLGSDFPILAAVTVPAGSDTIYLSGALGSPVDKTAPKDSRAAYGDTEAQTLSALTNIKGTLARLGLGMGDVVKVTMFIAGDSEKGGKMDFMGMMKSYRKFFGTPDQPNLPTRSAVQVAALAAPWALIEIEVTAAKAHATN